MPRVRKFSAAGEFDVGSGQFGAAVHHQHDGMGFLERDPRLAKNLGGDVLFIFGNDAPGIDHAKAAPVPLGGAVEAVARDAGLVADNGAASSDDAVKQRGLADIRPANDGEGCGTIRGLA